LLCLVELHFVISFQLVTVLIVHVVVCSVQPDVVVE
jgi:hypothetical protein